MSASGGRVVPVRTARAGARSTPALRGRGKPVVRRAAPLLVLLLAACGGGARPAAEPGLPPAESAEVESPAETEGLPQFTILYFNDLHGHLVPFTQEGDTSHVGGAARMASVVRRVREENAAAGRPTLLVEGGDIFQGTPLSSMFKGEPDFRFLNMIGLDAMVLGNHEFDFGIDVLRQRMREANFPILAANVRIQEGGQLLTTPYVIRRLPNGVRVAIVGFVTDETPETTDPINVSGLVFQPPVLAAARYIPALQDSADVVVALTHIGTEADRLLADTHDEIDVIIGGHDQVLLPRPLAQEDVLIAQAREHGLYLGRLDVAVEADGEVELVGDTLYEIAGHIPEDPDVAAMVASYTKRLDRELSKTVGRLGTPLQGNRSEVRRRPTNFGVLLAELMLARTGADVAVMNSGGIRSSIDAGPVTLGEIVQALPFANRVMTVQLSGGELERVLERSARAGRTRDGGGYLQLAGFGPDPSACTTSASAGCIPTIGGEPLDPGRIYTVAMTDFLFNGGDGYDVFKRDGRNPRQTGALLADLLARHIAENSPLSVPAPEGAPAAAG